MMFQSAFFVGCSFIFGEETCEIMKMWLVEFGESMDTLIKQVSGLHYIIKYREHFEI